MVTKPALRWGVFALCKGLLCSLFAALLLLNARAAPGDLSAVHGRERTLQGMNGCRGCHGAGPKEAMGSHCSSCHADVQAHIAGKSGFHGTLPADKASDCGRCHAEHMGMDFLVVNARSFALAGIDDPSKFDHAGLPYRLAGKHAGAGCTQCHRLAEARVLEKGQKRFMGLDQRCTRCHEDAHKGSFDADCDSCHGQEQPFKVVPRFDHTRGFPLTGAHAGVLCSACHAAETAHAVPALLKQMAPLRAPPVAVRSCPECHRSPHREEFLAKTAEPLGTHPHEACVQCHAVERGAFLGPKATLSARQHAGTGFPLEIPHNNVTCDKCHEGYGRRIIRPKAEETAAAYRHTYPGRRADDCRACHGDPHKGQFELGPFKGQACLACHAPHAFTPSAFDAATHDRASFRLEGRHRTVQCWQCHTRPESSPVEPRIFHGTPSDCRTCHQDPHEGQFDKGALRGQDCRACHTMDGFRPPAFTVAMHAKTRFPLTGTHLGVSCAQCHAVPEPDPSQVPPRKRPRVYVGTPTDCRACHQDVHRGRFDGPGMPAVVSDQRGCARCHQTGTFRALRDGAFDHAPWTGYPLRGAHAKLDCAACHGRAAKPDSHGRTLGPAAGTRCQSCHSDPHVAQFGPTPSVNCANCHKEDGKFRDIVFDHQKDSRFRLDERHSKLACSACHKPAPLPGGATAVRYKPLGIECRDCHEPRGPK